jgi:hypothetical protein
VPKLELKIKVIRFFTGAILSLKGLVKRRGDVPSSYLEALWPDSAKMARSEPFSTISASYLLCQKIQQLR